MENLKRVQPPVFPAGKINIPEAIFSRLDNGIPVYLIQAGTEEIMRVEFFFRAGQIKDSIPLLASTTNLMLTEGSQNYTSEELHRILEFYGAFLHMTADKDSAGLIVFALNRHLAKIFELCFEILFHPVFPDIELNALMNKRLQWYRINQEKVQNLAMDNFFEAVFGKKHPYGYVPLEHDFNQLSNAMLADFHSRNYVPGNMSVLISGKIPENTVALLNQNFGNMKHSLDYKNGCAEGLKGEKKKKIFIDKQGAVQSAIRIGSTTINKRHPDYPGLKVLDCLLGGYFGSRLMRNIREEKGYTYSIRSSLSSLDLSGFKVISTEVGHENYNNAINEIYKEILTLQQENVPGDELEVVRNYMLGEMLRMFDGPFAIAESFKAVWEFGLNNDYYYRFIEKIKSIGPDEIKYLANTYYNVNDLYEVIVGSK